MHPPWFYFALGPTNYVSSPVTRLFACCEIFKMYMPHFLHSQEGEGNHIHFTNFARIERWCFLLKVCLVQHMAHVQHPWFTQGLIHTSVQGSITESSAHCLMCTRVPHIILWNLIFLLPGALSLFPPGFHYPQAWNNSLTLTDCSPKPCWSAKPVSPDYHIILGLSQPVDLNPVSKFPYPKWKLDGTPCKINLPQKSFPSVY